MSALFGKGCLVMSDQLNHASIALGCRLSGANIEIFKHNDMVDLEQKVRHAILTGQPHTGKSWKKIIVIVEGIYSMEGTIVNLPEILRIKKTYKLYVYVDEAHSIGAIGPQGRGVCDYYGCNPRDIDILMGTFTKSFAAAGGYMAGNEKTIRYLRSKTAAYHYGTLMAAPVAQQIISVLSELYYNQNQSHERLKRIHENTLYFRQKLKQLGYHLDGNDDSPVVPLMVYMESYLKYLLIKLMESGIATIGVAYPVTSLIGVRIRLCVSASHTRAMLDKAIETIDTIGSQLAVNFNKSKVLK
ncbi:serine palmitoyltransferase 2-like [Oppia nitens]|uniref:serine palmitoyltransferase 2-like n=1 Tax=Oppia nitens TaxID=1686743 RepID=UPI0023D99303|nr:serine palmitoyltransferase 2-like [Oppia nitens]